MVALISFEISFFVIMGVLLVLNLLNVAERFSAYDARFGVLLTLDATTVFDVRGSHTITVKELHLVDTLDRLAVVQDDGHLKIRMAVTVNTITHQRIKPSSNGGCSLKCIVQKIFRGVVPT